VQAQVDEKPGAGYGAPSPPLCGPQPYLPIHDPGSVGTNIVSKDGEQVMFVCTTSVAWPSTRSSQHHTQHTVPHGSEKIHACEGNAIAHLVGPG
jgi:hypothetical protein